MTVPVAGSMPPHRDKGSSRRTTRPRADPANRVRPWRASASGPEAFVTPDPSFRGGPHALLQTAVHDLDPDVPWRVVRPLPRVGHDDMVGGFEDGRDVRARVDDKLHARPAVGVEPPAGLDLGQHLTV